MSASKIKAGEGFFEFFAKDSTKKTIDAIAGRLKSLGKYVTAVGAALTTAAAAGLGGMGAALTDFADFGSEIVDAMSRTALGGDMLQTVAFQAGQAGGSLQDVTAAARTMNKTIAAAASGGKSAVKSLAGIGLTAEQLLAMNPDQRFAAIADGIAKIEDPGQRSAAAMKVLGKSASNLMEVLSGGAQGIADAQKELAAAGLILSPEDLKNADALGDAWGKLTTTLRAAIRLIGASLAPTVTDLINRGQAWLTWLTEIIDNNREWIKWLAYGMVILFAVGASITAVGGTLFLFGAILAALPALVAGVGTAIGAVTAVFAAIASPAGLAIAAVAALWAILPIGLYIFDQLVLGGAGLRFIGDVFQEIWSIGTQTVRGIFDAISSGNWGLAGEIAINALYVALQTGWGWIKMGVLDLFTWLSGQFIDFFGQELIGLVAGGMKKILDLINRGAKALGGPKLFDTSGFAAVVKSAEKGSLKADLERGSKEARAAIAKDIAAARGKLTTLTEFAGADRARKSETKIKNRGMADLLPPAAAIQEFKQTISAGTSNSSAALRLGMQIPVFDEIKNELAAHTELLKQVADNTEGLEGEGLDD